ncbi:hypothetical protein [Sphingomonas mollis]|uniref:Uncharacterized protein n=1 Tax=Sphingomonas mollis TaxID=2795726 RepID=A0ABS0XPI2_9SPHN|nr:hypothetical protein [Sphingomonas sp. BT553]MBJ6121949.1 hypothetical protein [Sphingomonas sp. BT553]
MAKRSATKPPAIMPRTDIVVAGQRMDVAYRVPALAAKAPGPWQREADKVAWTDPSTGYACIIRRMPGGHLGGFVAVPAGHPLAGWTAEAVPPQQVRAHGGLDYARACDERGPEAVSICHVKPDVAGAHDTAWWFGFSCDQPDDLVPDHAAHAAEARQLGVAQTYRNAEYVLDRCTELAADLARVEERR